MTHGNPKGEWVMNETKANIEAQMAKLEQQVKYCQEKIKWYQEELERRKQEGPLGVPLEHLMEAKFVQNYMYCFASEKSLKIFDCRLATYVEALQKLAKGEPIIIDALLPLLRKGWVAMDKNGEWHWYEEKPNCTSHEWLAGKCVYLYCFNIKPADDWETSLMECGL